MSSTNQCASGDKCCCKGSKVLLFITSLLFTVSSSFALGVIMAFPVALYTRIFNPELFASYAEAFLFLAPAFAVAFIGIALLTRLAHVSLEGKGYFKNTFFYEYIAS